jgi:hypothetical protein
MSSLPKKGDIIINPQTQRPVKVGSRTWLKLVRQGLVEGKYSDPNEIYTIKEGDDEQELINQFNQSLPPNQQAVRGRGKYANKIVKRHRQPNTETTSRYTVKTTARKLKNRDIYEDLQEGGNFEEDLEALIMEELTKMNMNNYVSNVGDIEEEQADDYEYNVGDIEDEEEEEEEEYNDEDIYGDEYDEDEGDEYFE